MNELTFLVSEAAEVFGISKRTLQYWIKEGRLWAEQVQGNGGRQYRIRLQDLLPYINPKRLIEWFRGLEDPGPAEELILEHGTSEQRLLIAGLKPGLLPEGTPEQRALELFERWRSAAPHNKRYAEARLEILQAVKAQSEGSICRAEETFARRWNQGLIKDLPQARELEPRLSASTLRRWRKAYEREGLCGLLPAFGNGGPQRAITPEQAEFIVSQIKARPQRIKASRIWQALKELFPSDCPSYRTVARFIQQWIAQNLQELSLLQDPRVYRSRFRPAFGRADEGVERFCGLWEIDSTKADVMVRDKKGRQRRLQAIALVDVFSRRAKVLLSDTERATATAALLREAILDWGIPERIRTDRGKGFVNSHIRAVLDALGVGLVELPPYCPEGKPFVERFIQTFCYGLCEELPGYVGHNVAERQALREAKAWARRLLDGPEPVELPLTEEEFREAVRSWLYQYERRPHKGLGGKTPLERAAESPVGPARISNPRLLDVLVGPEYRRKLSKKGFMLEGRIYVSEELVDRVGEEFTLRINLKDISEAYVFDSEGRFVCVAYDRAVKGLDLDLYLSKKRELRKRERELIRAARRLSLAAPGPYHIKTSTGELTYGVRRLHQTPAMRELKKAFEPRRPERGLAQQLGVGPGEGSHPSPAETSPPLPEVKPIRFPGPWDRIPEELSSPIDIYEWFELKEQAVGLTDEDRQHMEYLKREFPQVRDWLEVRQRRPVLEKAGQHPGGAAPKTSVEVYS